MPSLVMGIDEPRGTGLTMPHPAVPAGCSITMEANDHSVASRVHDEIIVLRPESHRFSGRPGSKKFSVYNQRKNKVTVQVVMWL